MVQFCLEQYRLLVEWCQQTSPYIEFLNGTLPEPDELRLAMEKYQASAARYHAHVVTHGCAVSLSAESTRKSERVESTHCDSQPRSVELYAEA